LALGFVVKTSLPWYEELLIRVVYRVPEIKMIHGAERLQMVLVSLAADVSRSNRFDMKCALPFSSSSRKGHDDTASLAMR